jgi:hypothetical protein
MSGPGQIGLELVAQWHGKINQLDFAPEVMKIACWYHGALVAIELTGGYGRPVMQRLKDEFFYWNLYREKTDVAMLDPQLDSRFGVETNAQTKGPMVAALQYMVKHGLVQIPCQPTLQEMRAFEQEKVGAGGAALQVPRFRGTKGYPDDRVMSLVICASVAQSYKPLQIQVLMKPKFEEPDPLLVGRNQENAETAAFWDALHKDLKKESNPNPFEI